RVFRSRRVALLASPGVKPTSTSEMYDSLWSGAWGDMQTHGPVHRHTQRELARVVRSLGVSSILDVGCGAGDNLATPASDGDYELTGVDVSSQAIELASRRVPSARFKALDVQVDRLPDQFDLV